MTRGRALALALAGVVVLVWLVTQLAAGGDRQTGSNRLAPLHFAVTAPARAGMCQRSETLFAGTGKLRLTIGTFDAPRRRLDLEVRSGRTVLATGHLAPGWIQGVADIPIGPVPKRSVDDVTVCVRSPAATGRLTFGGEYVDPTAGAVVNGAGVDGRVSLLSYAPGRPSLLHFAGTVATHYGHGGARFLGGWTLWLISLLALAGVGFAGVALVRPRARYPVAAVLAIGTAWALLIPPFMVPDEPAHFAYVQTIVEAGTLPTDKRATSAKEETVLGALGFSDVIGDTTSKPPWTAEEEARLRQAERLPLSRVARGAGTASANPPLYYLAEVPVYAATRGASPLVSLVAMRLLSVLLGGLTVFCVFAFLRELLPRLPVAWSFGALAVALQPLFGYITAGVNADAGLFAASAGTFWAMAVVLRRGPSWRRVAALGGVLAAGMLIKPLFAGLVPAALLALALAALREPVAWRRRIELVGAGVAIAVVPVGLYSLIGGALADHPYIPGGVGTGLVAATPTVGEIPAGWRSELVYVWQLFAPRLPFMQDFIPGHPLRDIWFTGFVGRFGWLDFGFAKPALDQAALVAYAVLALAAAGFVHARRTLPARWRELLCLVVALAGVLAVIGTQQYRAKVSGGSEFSQARYLFPLLALYGALGAVAVRGLGRRAAPYVATAFVTLAVIHELAAMLLTVTRFYA